MGRRNRSARELLAMTPSHHSKNENRSGWPSSKARKRGKYTEVRGSATYVIHARSKEEAERIARERFDHEAFDERESFRKANLDTRITSFATFTPKPRQPGQEQQNLNLEWKNSKTGSWRSTTDKESKE